MVRELKFVVTGTGRSGTTWVSEILRAVGLRVGHQSCWKHGRSVPLPAWYELDGDVSFEAVPTIPALRSQGVRVVHVMRDPFDVVASWVNLGVFADDFEATHEEWANAMRFVCPEALSKESPIDRAGQFWLAWNEMGSKWAHDYYWLEDLSSGDARSLRLWSHFLIAIGRRGVGPVTRELVLSRDVPKNSRLEDKVFDMSRKDVIFSMDASLASQLSHFKQKHSSHE